MSIFLLRGVGVLTLDSIVLVPRTGKRRRRKSRSPRPPVKQVKAEHSPQEQHNAVAEKQEVTATTAEQTGTPPEVPNNAGQETAGSGGSKGLIHTILNHPLVHEGAKAGLRAATAALNDYANRKAGMGSSSTPYDGGTRPADDGLGYE